MEHVLVDGECVSCSRSQPVGMADPAHLHVLDNGICTTCDGEDLLDEDSAALLQALNEMDRPLGNAQRAAWDPAKHVRNPKGPGGGRFRSNVDKLKDAIAAHKAGTHDGHPFDGFNREQLRKVAKARGIELKRGEDRDSIAAKLLDHLGGEQDGKSVLAAPKVNNASDVRKAKDHADAIGSSRSIAWAQRDRVKRELARQAELTPRNMLELDSVHAPALDSKHGSAFVASDVVGSAMAYYSPLGSSPAVYGTRNAKRGDGPAIWLSPHWASDTGIGKSSVAHIHASRDGYFAPSGAESPLESVLAHEYGHHVARVFEGEIGFGGAADMPGDLGERFLPALNEALGANRMSRYPLRGDDHDLLRPVHFGTADHPRYAVPGQLLNSWVHENKDLISSKVSKYGAQDFAEMLAEIWQEYSTKGPDARPHIRVIGDLMREIAEEART